MAKKTQRNIYGLICTVCKSQNYVIQRNKLNTPTALKLSRYCHVCKKHTEHKEIKSLD